jgi:hypothetical protein
MPPVGILEYRVHARAEFARLLEFGVWVNAQDAFQ